MGREGIEPSTPRASVVCSPTELPSHSKKNYTNFLSLIITNKNKLSIQYHVQTRIRSKKKIYPPSRIQLRNNILHIHETLWPQNRNPHPTRRPNIFHINRILQSNRTQKNSNLPFSLAHKRRKHTRRPSLLSPRPHYSTVHF